MYEISQYLVITGLFTELFTEFVLFTELFTEFVLFTELFTEFVLFTELFTEFVLFTELFTEFVLFTELFTEFLQQNIDSVSNVTIPRGRGTALYRGGTDSHRKIYIN